jgi:hypothetical protein
MTESTPLVPLPEGAELIERSRQTLTRWQAEHPGLGLAIGGRMYSWRAALVAIATGHSLDEAEAIGRAELARYTATVHDRIIGSASERAAA